MPEVKSTNEYLLDKIHKKKYTSEGIVIFATKQTQGRGIDHSVWESEPGKNLTVSFLIKPHFIKADRQFMINKMTALAVYDLIKHYLPDLKVSIKWPNDIYIDKNKIAGILIHQIVTGNKIEYSVLGIGININQTKFLSDAPNPVSVLHYLKGELNLENCLSDLCDCMEERYRQLSNADFKIVNNDYLKALFRFGEFADYYYKGELISAKIKGITDIGRLRLVTRENENIECDFKELVYVL
ncbi:MAG: biotin--[acetyl-CoA-carboxylase] ligase [Bacteroidales bacterium]|nr:biotin--[acetyl-CoA-carboxylase] ligase [Bacteroidales bacterium]